METKDPLLFKTNILNIILSELQMCICEGMQH